MKLSSSLTLFFLSKSLGTVHFIDLPSILLAMSAGVPTAIFFSFMLIMQLGPILVSIAYSYLFSSFRRSAFAAEHFAAIWLKQFSSFLQFFFSILPKKTTYDTKKIMTITMATLYKSMPNFLLCFSLLRVGLG